MPDPAVLHRDVFDQSQVEALATLANSKANLAGKPYTFIPHVWACKSEAAMLNCWKSAATGTPGGVVIRCDQLLAYRFTGTDYKSLSSWTVQPNWHVVDSTVTVGTIPGAAGEFLYQCEPSPAEFAGRSYRWDTVTNAWKDFVSLHYTQWNDPAGLVRQGEGGWLGEFVRLRSNILKALYGTSYGGNPLLAGTQNVKVVRNGETYNEAAEVGFNKVYQTKPFAFTMGQFPQLPVAHFRDIQAVFPISGATNPKLVIEYKNIVADVLPTGTEFAWPGTGNWTNYAHKRIEIHLKGDFGWMKVTGRLQIDFGMNVVYGTIPSGKTRRFLNNTDPDPIFTAGDSRGLGTTAHVVHESVSGQTQKGVTILADINWDGDGELVLWAELDPASDIWFWNLPWFYVGPNQGTFQFIFDTPQKTFHIHNTSQQVCIPLPVNPLTENYNITIWSKQWDTSLGTPPEDHWDNRDPNAFTWLQTSGRTLVSMQGITGGCWYARPRPLVGLSVDKFVDDWVNDGRTNWPRSLSILRRYSSYSTQERNVNSPDSLTVNAPEMQVSRMIGWGFPKCYVRSYDEIPNTGQLQQSHPRVGAYNPYFPMFGVIVAVMVKKLNWEHVFNKKQQHVGDPTHYLDPITVDIGFVQNGSFLTLQTVTLDQWTEAVWIYPHWINFTQTSLTYRARCGTTKVKADVQAIICCPDPKLLGETTDMPQGAGGSIPGSGTPILAFHYNDTVRLLNEIT